MATADQKKIAKTDKDGHEIAAVPPPRLPYHPSIEERFGIDKASWKALVEAIFPNATSTESVILALSYCRARNLDPFKRNVHIVPIYNSDLQRMVDTVWPGIGELRTTAFRTGEYAGRGETVFGIDVENKIGKVEMIYPEWAQVTVKRIVKGHVVEFVGPRVYWEETYAVQSRNDDSPNSMWRNRPRGQLEKCAEAAALRAAFPEEIGTDYIPEEVQHRIQPPTFDAIPEKPRTVDDLMNGATEKAKPNGFKDHTGPMLSDKELADRELGEQTNNDAGEEAEQQDEPQQEAKSEQQQKPKTWRDNPMPEGLLTKLEAAVTQQQVEDARAFGLENAKSYEEFDGVHIACDGRLAELEASKKAGGKKKQGNLV